MTSDNWLTKDDIRPHERIEVTTAKTVPIIMKINTARAKFFRLTDFPANANIIVRIKPISGIDIASIISMYMIVPTGAYLLPFGGIGSGGAAAYTGFGLYAGGGVRVCVAAGAGVYWGAGDTGVCAFGGSGSG